MKRENRKKMNIHRRQVRNRAKIYGSAEKPRLSVFRSNKHTYVQLIDDQKGVTVASASTKELKKKAVKTELAKMLGSLIGEKAKKVGINQAIFNRGAYLYHGRVKAIADGAREAGLKI